MNHIGTCLAISSNPTLALVAIYYGGETKLRPLCVILNATNIALRASHWRKPSCKSKSKFMHFTTHKF